MFSNIRNRKFLTIGLSATIGAAAAATTKVLVDRTKEAASEGDTAGAILFGGLAAVTAAIVASCGATIVE